ncbi:hypothetical protein [Acetobacterium wieringae]|uniref:hypothetical protein n=1 Tax=Acetobacterium wieringae TaxID=52694 RepID=UPI0020331DC7|nr:hypothetical protein [Acetobacterium wieringae]URN83953.1 hypothetical protein CHL1_003117 [Acetobacterium wieringae]
MSSDILRKAMEEINNFSSEKLNEIKNDFLKMESVNYDCVEDIELVFPFSTDDQAPICKKIRIPFGTLESKTTLSYNLESKKNEGMDIRTDKAA